MLSDIATINENRKPLKCMQFNSLTLGTNQLMMPNKQIDKEVQLIRIQFWNGQLDKKGSLVTTKHNPCLWTNYEALQKPWRNSYKQAIVAIETYFRKESSDTKFLHDLRYVAYGLGKRDYHDQEVVWWGNMTEKHRPKLVVENRGHKMTITFQYHQKQWKASVADDLADFYWPL